MSLLVIFFSVFAILSFVPTSSAQQLFPEVDLECDDQLQLDFLPGYFSGVVNCELTNPTTLTEEVEISYQSGELTASGPESVTVEGGETVDFLVVILAENDQLEGFYEINVSAVITQWAGAPVSIFGFSDEELVEIEVLPYTLCSISGPSSIFVESGEDVSFSIFYECDSNEQNQLEVSLHLLEKGSTQEDIWPSGFNDLSQGGCIVQNPMGSVGCDFLLTTPPNLQIRWEGCLVVIDEITSGEMSCTSNFAFPLTVNEREVVVPNVGIDVNGTILEDLGVTPENQNIIFGGSAAFLVVSILLLVVWKRRVG
ncbi:MAG: hypothetical protein CMB61_03370 [Euryarchaeota archaeon]|nr:hypothetical protein [Euryarchaeota archaeon]